MIVLLARSAFFQERIRRDSDESKHAETHYAQEKVKDTPRPGGKGRGKSRGVERLRERGSAGLKEREKEQRGGT